MPLRHATQPQTRHAAQGALQSCSHERWQTASLACITPVLQHHTTRQCTSARCLDIALADHNHFHLTIPASATAALAQQHLAAQRSRCSCHHRPTRASSLAHQHHGWSGLPAAAPASRLASADLLCAHILCISQYLQRVQSSADRARKQLFCRVGNALTLCRHRHRICSAHSS